MLDLNQILPTVRRISDALKYHHHTVATMESCTAGLVAFYLTAIDGSSEYLTQSFVTYSNAAKISAGVSERNIELHSVYSSQVAEDMAVTALIKANSDYGLGITGLCGPDDYAHGALTIPAGDVYIGFAFRNPSTFRIESRHINVAQFKDRNLKRHHAAITALDFLLSHLI